MITTFPILLTLAQPGTTDGNMEDDWSSGSGCPRDLFKTTYVQADRIEDDRVDLDFQSVSSSSRKDEFALCAAPGGFLYQVDKKKLFQGEGKPKKLPTANEARLLPDGRLLEQTEGGKLQCGQECILQSEHRIRDFEVDAAHGRVYAALDSDELIGVDLGTKEVETLRSGVAIREFALSPQGDAIAFVDDQDEHVYVDELATGERRRMSDEDAEADWSFNDFVWRGAPQFSPDGSRVLYCNQSSFVDGYELDSVGNLFVAGRKEGCPVVLLGGFDDGEFVHSAVVLES